MPIWMPDQDYLEYLKRLDFTFNTQRQKDFSMAVSTKKAMEEQIPQDYAQLKQAYVVTKQALESSRKQLKDLQNLYHKQNDQLSKALWEMDQTPSIDHIYGVLTKYIKVNKLNIKLIKQYDIVSQFISALEYSGVPQPDDELVD